LRAQKAPKKLPANDNTINDPAIKVVAINDDVNGTRSLRVERLHHGNIKVSNIESDFVVSADYKVLENAAATFKGLLAKAHSSAVAKANASKKSPCRTSTTPCCGCAKKPNAASPNSATKVWAK
jgi:DNA gyrase subunit B